MTTLTELQSSLAEMGEPAGRTIISAALYRNLSFMGEWSDRSHSWEKGTWQHTWSLQKGTWKTLRAWGKRLCGLMRWKLNSLAWAQCAMSGGNRAQLITHLTPSLSWSMVVASSFYGDAFQHQRLGDPDGQSWYGQSQEDSKLQLLPKALLQSIASGGEYSCKLDISAFHFQ